MLNPKGSTPAEVMGVDYKSTIKPALESYSQKIKKDSVETLDELILLQHQSSALSANIEEKRNDIATFQSHLDEVSGSTLSLSDRLLFLHRKGNAFFYLLGYSKSSQGAIESYFGAYIYIYIEATFPGLVIVVINDKTIVFTTILLFVLMKNFSTA